MLFLLSARKLFANRIYFILYYLLESISIGIHKCIILYRSSRLAICLLKSLRSVNFVYKFLGE